VKGTSTLTASIPSAPAVGSDSVNFEVVAPDKTNMKTIYDLSVKFPNPVTLIMFTDVYMAPPTVNFGNVGNCEDFCYATTSGYFDYAKGELHDPGTGFLLGTSTVVPEKGTLCSTPDWLIKTTRGRPYRKGTFTWDIPCYYFDPRKSVPELYWLETVPQEAELRLTDFGVMLIMSKAGASDVAFGPF